MKGRIKEIIIELITQRNDHNRIFIGDNEKFFW